MTKNLNVRLDDELHAQVKAAAEADDRSLNGEIVWLMKQGLEARAHPGVLPAPSEGIATGTGD